MLIGIDGNEANLKERVGVNVWAFELLKNLKATSDRRQAAVTNFLIYLSHPARDDLPREAENWKYRVIGPGRLWTRWRLPLDLYLHRPRPDVFLSLSHYSPMWSPCPRVVSIMDLSFLQFPEAFKPAVLWQLTHWTRESLRKAAGVVTISEFNKQEIINNYRYPAERITVVYPGVSDVFIGPPRRGRALSKNGIPEKYLLFVGTFQAKKNLPRLVEAFFLVRKRYPDVQLVLAGKTWGQFAEEKEERSRKKEEGISYLGYVPERDLPGLMAGAEALLLPSLYEGFGLPAVEAMSMGTPVLASNVTSLPEIIDDAGILFDPYDVKSTSEAMIRVMSMSSTDRRRLIKKGKIQAKKFDWEKAAENIMRILFDITKARSFKSPPLDGSLGMTTEPLQGGSLKEYP